MKYEPVIGLEIHVQLKTKSKMFCACSCQIWNEPPNSHTCPVCLGLPGALPTANSQAIKSAIMIGVALNCLPQDHSKFDRKNYFYPDLAKGYQISQFDLPFSKNGWVQIKDKKIMVNRAHLEEDTGKLIHDKNGTLIDFNRSGIPLIEIVSEPDISSAEEAREYGQKIQQIMRYLNVSDADIEKGNMRLEPNISLRREGEIKLPNYKVEIKNIGSVNSLGRAIEYEIKRQKEELDKGKKITQETRGWNESKQKTLSQRTKEVASDYRYFPEPDLAPFSFNRKYISQIKKEIPELPDQKLSRFISYYKLQNYDAKILVLDSQTADFFEESATSFAQTKVAGINAKVDTSDAKKVANYIINELTKIANEDAKKISQLDILPAQLAEIIYLEKSAKISAATAKNLLFKVIKTGKSPQELLKDEDLKQLDQNEQLEAVINNVILVNQKAADDYKSGKTESLTFLIGQVMKETKSRASPNITRQILEQKIKK
jgi:aspartyl-tRNA(Asn)/glutamyl-tRNA(Gln) amidotransferase subunit B